MHRSKGLNDDLIMMLDYEPQSDAATAALSFGCVFAGTIVSGLLSRLS